MSDQETVSFEKAFARLEDILEKMNSGTLALDESIKLYEEADTLIQLCNKRLNNAETKIEALIKNREGDLQLSRANTPEVEPFLPNAHG